MHVYIEIQADEPSRAVTFYTSVFPSWSFKKDEGLPIEYYRGSHTSSDGAQSNNTTVNILKRPAQVPPPECGTNAFTCSFPTDDIDDVHKKVLELGGKVAMEKFQMPGGWHAYFLDTEGNVFGVFESVCGQSKGEESSI